MTILKTLQKFISEYNGMTVLTDFEGKQSGYALQPTGNDTYKQDVLGNKYFQNNYIFYVREIAREEEDRADNQDFLEDFSQWLDEQNLPILPGRFVAQDMTVSNCMLMDIEEDGTGVYQVQIQLKIKKEVQ